MERVLRGMLRRELRCKPLYVILESECPPGLFNREMHGCTMPTLTDALQSYISHRWVGEGPSIYLADVAMSRCAERVEDVAGRIHGMAAHEAAHVVEFFADGLYRRDSPDWRINATLKALSSPLEESERQVETGDPPWGYHDERFFRLALHIAHRLRRHGHYCPVARVINSSWYGIASDVGCFSGRLSEEFEECESLTLFEVLARAPPRAYAELWRREIKEFEDSIPLRRQHTMFEFLERVRTAFETKTEKDAKSFKRLAIQIADGKEPKIEATIEVLREAGKSHEDLKAAVELISKRRKLRETLDAANGHEQRRADIDARFTAANAALEEAERLHEETCGPLRYQLLVLDEKVKAAQTAELDLQRTGTDPATLETLTNIRAEILRLTTQLNLLQKRIDGHLLIQLADAESRVRGLGESPNEKELAARTSEAQTARGFLEQTRAEVETLKQQINDLRRQEAEALATLLDPTAI
jgi:hypothetical protein